MERNLDAAHDALKAEILALTTQNERYHRLLESVHADSGFCCLYETLQEEIVACLYGAGSEAEEVRV
jgi:hypothetical protein